MRPNTRRSCVVLVLLALASTSAFASPQAVFPQASFQFERALSGAVVEHDFALKNEGSAPLRISRVLTTAPLVVTSMPASVAPGAETNIRVRLDTTGLRGHFPGEIHVFLNDAALPEATLSFEGQIVPLIEVSPAPAFFVGARRGEARQASIDVINHEPEPLQIEEAPHPRDRFSTTLETLQDGRRYRLTLFLNPDGPVGRHSESIVLKTSSRSQPTITVVANTYLRERVYTFPDAVDLGTVRLTDVDADPLLLQRLTQILMVYQFGGSDFRTSVRTDLPELELSSERGPQRDRYQNTVRLTRDKLKPGKFQGSIFIDTNDPEFPSLVVPVAGSVLP
jgi:Protein of unknown function (DUF1573)